MKTKLSIASVVSLAMTQFTNAMETTAPQQFHHSEIVEQNTTQSAVELKPLKFTLPNDIFRQFVLECPAKSRIRMRSVNTFTRDAVDKAHEAGKYLEELVFELAIHNKIYMNLRIMDPIQDDANDSDSGSEEPCFEGSYTVVNKLPKDIGELHNWCQNGYQLAEGEESVFECFTNQTCAMSTIDYSFRLFCFGIHNGYLPLVRYTLDQHNNFWNREKMSKQLRFDIGRENYSLSAFLILKDYGHILEFAIKNQKFCDFTFGTELKNGVGNTPLHSLAKWGKVAMIRRFLKEEKLVALCLLPENIKGDGGKDPAEIAAEIKQSPEIIDLFKRAIEKAAIENAEKTTIETII